MFVLLLAVYLTSVIYYRRVGPIAELDGGAIKIYCSDTVLRSTKNHQQKSVIRKLNIARVYNKKGAKKGAEKPFTIDIPAHYCKDVAKLISTMGNMMNSAPKPDFADYLRQQGPIIPWSKSQTANNNQE